MANTPNLGITKINASDYVNVQAFNDAFDKIDVLGKDYVTAVGQSGIWRYQKWKSGKVDCWGTHSAPKTDYTRPFGSFYYKQDMGAFSVSFPFTFVALPTIVGTIVRFNGTYQSEDQNVSSIWTCHIVLLKNNNFSYLPATANKMTETYVDYSVHVIGRL